MSPMPTGDPTPYDTPTPAARARHERRQESDPPDPARGNRIMAIVALVLSGLAFLGAMGSCAATVHSMRTVDRVDRLLGGAQAEADGYTGRAPGASEASDYPGTRLAKAVTAVLEEDGLSVQKMWCDETPVVEAGASTYCEGVIDGEQTSLSVNFQDDEGRYTLGEGI